VPGRGSRHRSLRFGALEAIAVLAIVAAALVATRSDADAKGVVSREARALAFLRGVVEAETAYKASGRSDADGDGVPEYGALAALVASGLLAGPLEKDADGEHLSLEGYRVEVLLPVGETPKGLLAWSRSRGPSDAQLAATTFAAVALPVGASRGDPRTLRAFYLDARGYGFAVDGVYSPDRDPSLPPPLFELRGGEKGDDGGREGGPLWRPFEKPAGVPLDLPGR